MSRLMPLMKSPEEFAVLQIIDGAHQGKQIRLMARQIVIGRHSGCDIILKNNKGCSRRHAKVQRKGSVYTIESLKPDNPVFVNKKPVAGSRPLKDGDTVAIGDMLCVFKEQSAGALAPAPKALGKPGLAKAPLGGRGPKGAPSKTFQKILIAAAVAGGALLYQRQEGSKKQALEAQKIRTADIVEEEMEALDKLTKEEEKRIAKLPPETGEAQKAFIKGFRDFRKGYYQRARRHFEHCSALSRKYALCSVYAKKSQSRLERLIQRKMVLGKEYRQKRQYKSCISAFKSVEIMVRDPSHAAFKEALKNRNLCQLKIQNQI